MRKSTDRKSRLLLFFSPMFWQQLDLTIPSHASKDFKETPTPIEIRKQNRKDTHKKRETHQLIPCTGDITDDCLSEELSSVPRVILSLGRIQRPANYRTWTIYCVILSLKLHRRWLGKWLLWLMVFAHSSAYLQWAAGALRKGLVGATPATHEHKCQPRRLRKVLARASMDCVWLLGCLLLLLLLLLFNRWCLLLCC